jgi:N-acyl-phosphatidylethanolamine-hydrolysing phospholipase D
VRSRAAALVPLLVLVACASAGTEGIAGRPAHHVPGGFRNPDPAFSRPSGWSRWTFILRRALQSITSPRRFDAPRVANDGAALRAVPPPTAITWIGHATLLVQVDGLGILTDPQWSDWAGPTSWLGPRRLGPPGLAFESLPRIDVVVISHDHFDHLDLPTVRRLAATHDPLFLVPLGLREWFRDNGMSHVEELDWWQEYQYRGVRFVCVPAQHFAQRAFWDGNRRLWASWAIVGRERRLYFGGDTGYFGGFREAGRRLGPFDVAALAIGSYLPAEIMKAVHTTPEEAVQAFLDLDGGVMLGMHWGTFDLAEEPLEEPPVRMRAEFERRHIDPARAWILRIGETRPW